MYLNSVQQMVSGELAGEGLQTGFSRHGLPPQRAPLDTVYPLREHLNSVQRMVSGGYCEGLFPDTVCWTQLRNTWQNCLPTREGCGCFWDCDPRVPLQRSKLEDQEMTILGSTNAILGGPSWNHLNGLFGASKSSLREGIQCPKKPI